ncbi:hypothetical protein PHAVU_010G122300 [Phaseolus vulgaris]|uniref:Uncharacterized protein n=1 Tax=Phaseolus vulgaris TaxID=3885 RepID=V7AP46_PHAVU|nr:hypothetical protein PHAVU_010G122300g [Phaseolus vulgaris]ESW07349.1 hypothetical protein PHAVU_010G122300g [Phaseolus vulgaris]
MRAKLVVFPVRGRNWCFTRTIDHSISATPVSSQSPSTLKELWTNVKVPTKPLNAKAELFVDFIANKMNQAWIVLEKAQDGSLKKKIHGLGLWLLSRVHPSEIFLKSISKEITSVEVVFPSSLNAQLVRRRLRDIALRGSIVHRKYFYGSISLIPLTSALSILPLPNVPFFWILFRAYSHWRAMQGGENLLELVSNSSKTSQTHKKNKTEPTDSNDQSHPNSHEQNCVLRPSKELDHLIHVEDGVHDGLSRQTIMKICKIYSLNTQDVIKYEEAKSYM